MVSVARGAAEAALSKYPADMFDVEVLVGKCEEWIVHHPRKVDAWIAEQGEDSQKLFDGVYHFALYALRLSESVAHKLYIAQFGV